jgi:ligand-binding sensor domain-containing protein
MHTIDGGNTWTAVASVTNLAAPPPLGSLRYGDVTAIPADSAGHLWLASTLGLAEYRLWAPGQKSPESTRTHQSHPSHSFDVQSPRTAWLLAPRACLWTTNDGVHWSALGPVATP